MVYKREEILMFLHNNSTSQPALETNYYSYEYIYEIMGMRYKREFQRFPFIVCWRLHPIYVVKLISIKLFSSELFC